MPEEVTDLRHKTAREKHTGMPARARQSAVTGHESGSTAALGVQNDARRSRRSASQNSQGKTHWDASKGKTKCSDRTQIRKHGCTRRAERCQKKSQICLTKQPGKKTLGCQQGQDKVQ